MLKESAYEIIPIVLIVVYIITTVLMWENYRIAEEEGKGSQKKVSVLKLAARCSLAISVVYTFAIILMSTTPWWQESKERSEAKVLERQELFVMKDKVSEELTDSIFRLDESQDSLNINN